MFRHSELLPDKTLQTISWLFVYSLCVRPPSYQRSQVARLELCSLPGEWKCHNTSLWIRQWVNISGMVLLASSLISSPLLLTPSCLSESGVGKAASLWSHKHPLAGSRSSYTLCLLLNHYFYIWDSWLHSNYDITSNLYKDVPSFLTLILYTGRILVH